MKIISIANRKGGVGKTSITANLAYELKKRGLLVLLIDIDQQCDLTKVFLPEESKGSTNNIYTLLCGQSSIDEACVEIEENLYMIPGSRDIVNFNFLKKANSLSKCLHDKRIADEVDIVLIDHPPSMSESALMGFVASDEVLIVTDTEHFSILNLGALIDDLVKIQHMNKNKFHILGIVANKVDMRRNLTKIMLAELHKGYGESVFKSWVSNDTAIPTANKAGLPVKKLHWQSRIVNQMKMIADEILERMGLAHGA